MGVLSKLVAEVEDWNMDNASVSFNTYPSFNIYPSFSALLSAFSTIAICLAGYYVIKLLFSDNTVSIRDFSKAHSWKNIKVTARSWYCSICEELLLNGIGVYCDCCGVCSDLTCIKKANLLLPCKIVTSKIESLNHHWVKGNLPIGAVCDVCQEECALEPGLVDFNCCWCNRAAHEECRSHLDKDCDFGPYKTIIVPPWCVQVAKRKGSFHRQMLLRGVKHPGWKNWCPLIVIANRKSGNNDGALVLSEFRRFLNPAQVIDLAERPPSVALQWSILTAPTRVKVLAAGGDGTVAWILTTAYKLDLEPEPAVGILPLGTGNDLSRVLGWGKQSSSDFDIIESLNKIQNAEPTAIDRWSIQIVPYRHLSNLGIRIPTKSIYMYNYLSIGVDAQVALDFHKARDSRFYVFSNRIFNKLLYLCFGTQQVMNADCKNLETRLELFLDGNQISLPELESIVVLNIQSWGAGVDLWGINSEKPSQSYNDGLLEVLGIYSSFHIAQMQVGLSKPYRIGQAKNVEIHLKASAPVQVDGEPWEQHSAQIKISLVNQATVLVNQS